MDNLKTDMLKRHKKSQARVKPAMQYLRYVLRGSTMRTLSPYSYPRIDKYLDY